MPSLSKPGTILAALLLAAPIVGSESAAAETNPCTKLKIVDRDAQAVGALNGSFDSPFLPGGGQTVFTIDSDLVEMKGRRICALIDWPKPFNDCGAQSAAGKCVAMVFINAREDSGKTKVTLMVPKKVSGFFGPPLLEEARARLVVYERRESDGAWTPSASFSGQFLVSGNGWATVIAVGSVFVFYLVTSFAVAPPATADGRSRWRLQSPVALTAGIFGRASLSRLQVFLFSLLVAGLLLYTWLRTGLLIELSEDLLLLLGVSAAGAGGAKFTAVVKKQPKPAVRAYLCHKNWLPSERDRSEASARWRDVLLTDDKLNVYKLQAAVFSVVVGIAVVGAWVTGTGIIDIPDSLLALMGVSQGVYVGGKAVSESNVADLEALIVELQNTEDAYLKAAGDKDPAALDGALKAAGDTTLSLAQRVSMFRNLAPDEYESYCKIAEKVRIAFQEMYGRLVTGDRLLPKPFCNPPSETGEPPLAV